MLFLSLQCIHSKLLIKNGINDPVITCKDYKQNRYGNRVEILDENDKVVATVKYQPNKPLSCGAKVWIETQNKIVIT